MPGKTPQGTVVSPDGADVPSLPPQWKCCREISPHSLRKVSRKPDGPNRKGCRGLCSVAYAQQPGTETPGACFGFCYCRFAHEEVAPLFHPNQQPRKCLIHQGRRGRHTCSKDQQTGKF